jgi:hypothetical protein
MIQNPYTRPTGLLGEIANFLYLAAPRPVPEIALAGAIGFMAGICGRAFNVSSTGLNLYVLLLAETGTGKEAMANGISRLIKVVRQKVPSAQDFIGPAEIASSQALHRHLAEKPSFVAVVGEFGLYLQKMSNPKASQHDASVLRALLHLFNKSGLGDEFGGTVYSDRSNNIGIVSSPALTILGEGTTVSFDRALDEGLIVNGLLPRFTIIEYIGERPKLNKEREKIAPPKQLVEALEGLCEYAHKLNHTGTPQNVELDAEATFEFDRFEAFATDTINATKNDVAKHLWNRAHLKALKLAALVAVGNNFAFPIVTLEMAKWAIEIERTTAQRLLAKFASGETGDQSNDAVRVNKLRQVFNGFFERPVEELEGYFRADKQLRELRASGVVSERYLFQRIANLAAFKNAPQGTKRAMKDAIEQLIEFGEVVRVSNKQLPNLTNSNAKLYTPSEESSIANGKLKEVVEARRKLVHLFDDAPPGQAV